jgi:hypothetical protein
MSEEETKEEVDFLFEVDEVEVIEIDEIQIGYDEVKPVILSSRERQMLADREYYKNKRK